MKNYNEIIKKIDLADECHMEIGGNFGRTMTITMEEAWLFKQLLEQQKHLIMKSTDTKLDEQILFMEALSALIKTPMSKSILSSLKELKKYKDRVKYLKTIFKP